MRFYKKFAILSVILLVLCQVTSSFATVIPAKPKPVTDLTRAYEVWTNQGIKFVVRDKNGQFVNWNYGKLESWGGKSKWVVRDGQGKLLTHAYGNVENWKNGQSKLVLRDSKGRLLTHVSLKITDKSSFASNVVGLRHLKNKTYLAFVQDTIADMLIEDIDKNEYSRTRVLVTYLNKYKNDKGVENFKPVLRRLLPKLNFVANHNPENNKVQELTKATQQILIDL